MSFEIESNVPVPPPEDHSTGISKTLRAMKVGDSVVIPKKDLKKWRGRARDIGFSLVTRVIDAKRTRIWMAGLRATPPDQSDPAIDELQRSAGGEV